MPPSTARPDDPHTPATTSYPKPPVANRTRRRARIVGIVAVVLLALSAIAFVAAWILTSTVVGEHECRPVVREHPSAHGALPEALTGDVLRVMTLNIAHGRSDGRHQALQGRGAIVSHLDRIAAVLRRERPEMVALQEADGPSSWSGRFDHVTYLAEHAPFCRSLRGEHVHGAGLHYGTALLSTREVHDPLSVTFAPSPPTFPKGFVVGAVRWPTGRETDIVSFHLDFSRDSVRRRQVADMVATLSARSRPMIVMGDANCGWADTDSPLRALVAGLDLHAFDPEDEAAVTFPTLRRRLDWILLSRELEFIDYRVVPDVVSDHFGVVAEVRWRSTGPR
jgi:endonuclease/exonuclease/phosphatase family metal-dependent hydrolase